MPSASTLTVQLTDARAGHVRSTAVTEAVPSARVGTRVFVYATDPVLRVGVAGQLADGALLELVSDEDAIRRDTVVVVVAESVDATMGQHLARLSARRPCGIVLVVSRLDDAGLLKALWCDVATVLWRRNASAELLHRTVLAVAKGQAYLPPDLLGRLLRGMRQRGGPPGRLPAIEGHLLTARERDVLRLVADGHSTDEIATALAYSERTIKSILNGVTRRLGLRNRSHAVAHLTRIGAL